MREVIRVEQARFGQGFTIILTCFQFGVIRNDAVRNSLPEADYIYTDVSLYNSHFAVEINGFLARL